MWMPAAAVPAAITKRREGIVIHYAFMSQRHRIQNNVVTLITSVTLDRERFFENPPTAREAVETLYRVRNHHPFFLYGFVIMPDHVHVLLKVPSGGSMSKIMNVYKSGLTFNTGIRQLWQSGFDSRIVREPSIALRYVHMNPVRSGIVRSPQDYSWSSANTEWFVDVL